MGDGRSTLAWLIRQYDEIEKVAREAAEDDVPAWELSQGRIIGTDPRYDSVIIDRSAEPTPSQRLHIVLHDPFTVLADIGAKREVIANLAEDTSSDGFRRTGRAIQSLAAALAHRPELLMG